MWWKLNITHCWIETTVSDWFPKDSLNSSFSCQRSILTECKQIYWILISISSFLILILSVCLFSIANSFVFLQIVSWNFLQNCFHWEYSGCDNILCVLLLLVFGEFVMHHWISLRYIWNIDFFTVSYFFLVFILCSTSLFITMFNYMSTKKVGHISLCFM